MIVKRSIFFFYLLLAPLVVALAQFSVLEFPSADFFTGEIYTPLPQVFYMPVSISISLFASGGGIIFVFNRLTSKGFFGKYRRLIWVCLSILFLIVFWFGINFSQRAVIFDYLVAINANGLHFLRMFYLPTVPEVFPNNGYLPFYTALTASSLGMVGTAIYFYSLYRGKNE